METVYDFFRTCRSSADQDLGIVGSIIITDYNNTTYRIDRIDRNISPTSTFKKNGQDITYMQYYKDRHNITIRDPNQPLLVSKAKAKQIRGGSPEEFFLIPELCRLTGITDVMRNNFRLMKAMSDHTRIDPRNRQIRLTDFNKRLHESKESMASLEQFGLGLDRQLVEINGRRLPSDTILFKDKHACVVKPNADWTPDLRSIKLFSRLTLNRWVLLTPRRTKPQVMDFLPQLFQAATGLGIQMAQPQIVELDNDNATMYAQALENCMRNDVQMIMAIVSNNNADRYAAIKKKCCVDRAIPSQVIVERTITPKNGNARGLLSIATKVAIQMNTKMGFAPWKMNIPISGLMVIGFDVCHDTRDRSRSFGAFVASMDQQRSDVYYSSACAHRNGEELSNSFGQMTRKALQCYISIHNELPKKIIVYRDGVGDGQFEFVIDHEVNQVKAVLSEIYQANNMLEALKMAFIVVTKRINTRVFNGPNNPPPGTVVDQVITMPERYDFFLVSQMVNQGTATPTNYNIIYDNCGLSPDRLQVLTHKLCHLYYNWTGTVRVPAVCQYAHKLSLLVGQYFHVNPNEGLAQKLYFL